MTGVIFYVPPIATRNPERRTIDVNGKDGQRYSFPLSELTNSPEVVDESLVGRKVTFNVRGQSDAFGVRLD
jgi:hypothetical protein